MSTVKGEKHFVMELYFLFCRGPLLVNLGRGKIIRSCVWKDEPRIDIREWGTPTHPTKNGVSLPLKRYLILRDNIHRISVALADLKKGGKVVLKEHLGRNVYAHVQTPYNGVNIRQWFKPKEDGDHLLPGKGIFLNSLEWNEFCKVDECMNDFVTELKDTVRCIDQTDHCNQLGYIACGECNPNGEFEQYL